MFTLEMPRWILQPAAICGLIALLAAAEAKTAESPGLGEPVSEAELAKISFTVMTDGSGLPTGAGTARTGQALFETHCAACHGPGGENGSNDRLAGGHGSLDGPAPVKTVGSYWPYATTIFDYVRRAMPYQSPGILGSDELYALTGYLLYINGIVEQDAEINARTLPQIEMPNRANFVWAVPER